MPSKRSHSSQFQFRGDGNKHPSPRKSAQKTYFRQSSSRDRGAQFSVPQTSSISNSQGTLRSSARINEIRARASQKASDKSGINGSQRDFSDSPQTGMDSHLKRKRPQVQRSFKPRTQVNSSSQNTRAHRSSVVQENASSRASSRKNSREVSREQASFRPQSTRRNSAKGSIGQSATSSIAEQNMSSHIWNQERYSSKRMDASRGGFKPQKGSALVQSQGRQLSGFDNTSRKGAQPLHGIKKQRRFPYKIVVPFLVIVLLLGGAFGIDSLVNGNKIYQGISIGEIDVSGLTQQEAVEQVSGYYSPRVSGNVATFYSSEEAQANPQTPENAGNVEEQISYEESLDSRTQWTLPASKLDATFDVEGMVEQAFQVGRNTGGIIARIQAALNGWHFNPECTFNETTLSETLSEMTAAVGNERVNYNVEMNDEGIASVTPGHDGNEVVRDWLVSRLNDTFFGSNQNNSYLLETQYMPLQITEDSARICADSINASLSSGATFSYEGQTWTASRQDLSQWITTSVKQEGDSWILKPLFDEATAKKALLSSLHSNIELSNLQVSISRDDQGTISVSSNATGTVPLISDAIASMNETFFVSESRSEAPTIELSSTDLPSTVSFDDAVDFGLISEISSFTTQYSSGAEARTVNIHTAADLLSNSIIKANGGTWSFNDTAGEATEDKGYQNAGAIVGGEYSDAIGGGICQVATTVFNAIYDAGYPITERHNHTLHIESYPEGRDAAIAYPYMDLVWQNDTSSDVILVMSYSNSSVTATLWGVDPGYEVSTDYGEWKEGEPYSVKYKTDDTVAEGTEYVETTGVNGSSISITRIVKDANGNVLHEDVFESNYAPKDEVIVRGSA